MGKGKVGCLTLCHLLVYGWGPEALFHALKRSTPVGLYSITCFINSCTTNSNSQLSTSNLSVWPPFILPPPPPQLGKSSVFLIRQWTPFILGWRRFPPHKGIPLKSRRWSSWSRSTLSGVGFIGVLLQVFGSLGSQDVWRGPCPLQGVGCPLQGHRKGEQKLKGRRKTV